MVADRKDLSLSSETKASLKTAGDVAKKHHQNYLGTEHLLLGLIQNEEGTVSSLLKNFDIDTAQVRSGIEFAIGRGERFVSGAIGWTPRSRKVFEFAIDEARRSNSQLIRPEHMLIGLIREGEGVAATVLESCGMPLSQLRDHIRGLMKDGVLLLPSPEERQEEDRRYRTLKIRQEIRRLEAKQATAASLIEKTESDLRFLRREAEHDKLRLQKLREEEAKLNPLV
jgi:ATP-dependent Clp protease ATP-binding subunit ClpA